MKRPLFVVGCPRSGTTVLYSMLVASGGFAFYRKETHLFVVAHRYPNLASDDAEADVESCERAAGQLMEELGYTSAAKRGLRPSAMTRAAYLSYFRVRYAIKSRTPLGRLMTRDNVWAEQPRAGERPVREIPSALGFEPMREGDVVIPPGLTSRL